MRRITTLDGLLKALGFVFLFASMSGLSLALPVRVPELDPSAMAGAVALAVVGLMMIAGRRRRQ